MIIDNLTASALVIAIILIIVAISLTIQKRNANKKINTVTKQMSLIVNNNRMYSICKRIYSKYPELCAGIDFTLKENGDDIEIDKWNSNHPRPDLKE